MPIIIADDALDDAQQRAFDQGVQALAADRPATEPPETGEGVSIPGRTVTTQRTTGTVKVRMTTRRESPESGKEQP